MSKRKIVFIFKIIVGVLLLTVLFRQFNKGDAILAAIKIANYRYILIAFILLLPNYFVQFLKWRYILKLEYPITKNKEVLQSLLFGSTMGFVTPGNLGELTRAVYFKRFEKMKLTGLNIIDKLFNMAIFVTLGSISMTIIFIRKFELPQYLILSVVIICGIILLFIWIVLLRPQVVRNFLKYINQQFQISPKMSNMFSSLDHLQPRQSVMITLLGILWFLIIFFQYHTLILAFEKVPVFSSYLAVSALLFTKILLPISFADLGIREGASVFYYTLFGVEKAAAFNAALLIFSINFLVPALAGSYFVFRLKTDHSND